MIACIINVRRACDAEQAPIDVLPRRSSEKQGVRMTDGARGDRMDRERGYLADVNL